MAPGEGCRNLRGADCTAFPFEKFIIHNFKMVSESAFSRQIIP
jgi:hypothetical protein